MIGRILLATSTVMTIMRAMDDPLRSIVSTLESTASGLERIAMFLDEDFKRGEEIMLQDFMCSDCGVEYEDDTSNPEGCPSCECQDKVRVLVPATDGAMHGSSCLEND